MKLYYRQEHILIKKQRYSKINNQLTKDNKLFENNSKLLKREKFVKSAPLFPFGKTYHILYIVSLTSLTKWAYFHCCSTWYYQSPITCESEKNWISGEMNTEKIWAIDINFLITPPPHVTFCLFFIHHHEVPFEWLHGQTVIL